MQPVDAKSRFPVSHPVGLLRAGSLPPESQEGKVRLHELT